MKMEALRISRCLLAKMDNEGIQFQTINGFRDWLGRGNLSKAEMTGKCQYSKALLTMVPKR